MKIPYLKYPREILIIGILLISLVYYFHSWVLLKKIIISIQQIDIKFWAWIIFEKGTYLFSTSIIFINSFFIGYYILSKIVFTKEGFHSQDHCKVELYFMSIVLGLGVIGQGTMILGLFKMYRPIIFWGIHSSLFVIGLLWFKCNYRKYSPKYYFLHDQNKKKANSFIWKYIPVIILVLVAVVLYSRMNYIGGSDAQTSHIAAPLHWIENGGYVPFIHERTGDPYTMNSTQPLMGRMLYLNGIILINPYIAALMQAVFFGMVILGVFLLGSRLFGRKVAWISVLLLLGNAKFFYYHLYEVDDYLVNIIFLITTAFTMIFYRVNNNKNWLLVFGLSSGFLLCVKYYGIIEVSYFFAVGIIYLYYSKIWTSLPKKTIIMVLALMILIPSPWFIKNIIVFGSPIWPKFSAILGDSLGYVYDLPVQIRPYRGYLYLLDTISETDQSLVPAYIRYIFLNLLANSSNGYLFSPIYLPILIFGLFFHRTRYLVIGICFYFYFVLLGATSMAYGHKWMIIIYSVLSPIVANIIVNVFKKKAFRYLVYSFLVILVCHTIDRHGLQAREFIPKKTWNLKFNPNVGHEVNKLGQSAKLYSGFIPNIMYNRTDIHIPLVIEWDILAEDWEETFCYWKRKGITHYYLDGEGSSSNKNRWPKWIPFLEKWDPEKLDITKRYSDNFEKNLKRRSEYLSQYGDITKRGIIELPEELPCFCEGKGIKITKNEKAKKQSDIKD
jgi:hypothetical protein